MPRRRRLSGKNKREDQGPPFCRLREMRNEGQITSRLDLAQSRPFASRIRHRKSYVEARARLSTLY
jgi:hypothetical protein